MDHLALHELIARPLLLPCGVQLNNRIVKSAMSDSLGDGKGNATEAQAKLYQRWAEGGVGLSLVGEVQIVPEFPERPSNLVLGEQADLAALTALARAGKTNRAHIWPQLGHGGGLAYAPVSKLKGPSALQIGDFQCDGFTRQEIEALPERYARAAKLAQQTGFTGVQIHAGHGFLLSQFLSPLFNRRDDEYGGDIINRSRIVLMIIDAVRSAVGDRFPVGIKINSSDQIEGGLSQTDALQFVQLLDQSSIDLIEISGGSYFPGATSCSDAARSGPYFVEFARQAKQLTTIPLVVTGGFKSLAQVGEVLSSGAADLVGLARAFVLEPELVQH